MRQVFQTAKSIRVLGNAASRVLEIFYRVFDELVTSLSFFLVGEYLPLIVSPGRRPQKAGSNSGALETTSPNEVLLFFHAVHFVKQLVIKKKLTAIVYVERETP